MKNQIKLFVDFDNTIVNSIKRICELYNDDFRYYPDFRHIEWTEVTTWGFKELSCADTDYISTYFGQPRFFDCLEYMDYAYEVLDELVEKFDIYIVTMGTEQNLKIKEEWINNSEFGGRVKFIGLNFNDYIDKSAIDMSGGIIIDDEIRYLKSSNADVKICFGDTYEWNKDWDGIRCHNWMDVLRYLDSCAYEVKKTYENR